MLQWTRQNKQQYSKCFLQIVSHTSEPGLLVDPVLWRVKCLYKDRVSGFPGGAVVENLPANAGDTGSSPGLGRFHMPRSN